MASLMVSSLFGRRKTVGFDAPSIIVSQSAAGYDSACDDDNDDQDDEDDDDDDDELGIKSAQKMLNKAMTYTRKSRFKSLVGDALQLTQQNRRASHDFTQGLLEKKTRRIQVMKKAINRKLPKFIDLIKTKDDKPIARFRRMARVVLLLIQVCNVCKDIVTQGVKREPWYALLDNLVATSNIKQKRKGPRAFVTFVPNEKRELIQLTFDVSEFKRDRRSEYIITDEVRDILSQLPGQRPPDQIAKVIRCMKCLFENFNNYPLSVQKQICQKAFYDKYRYNRVIVKKGQSPDGVYFVLSGSLIEKHDVGRQPREIQTGAMFGENDLVCGSQRRHTVLTRTDTELFYLHRQDYRVIFHMSEDSNDPKNLDICKQHIVFQHFPMLRLVDNPGTWSVLRYKYGRLIAKDSNNLDWIYVIKSGEARVFKYLQPGHIDVQARRKKVQAMINSQSAFHRKKKILNFVEEREYIKTSYSPRTYHPTTRFTMSAPAGRSRDSQLMSDRRREAFTCIPGTRKSRNISSSRNRKNSKRSSVALRKSDVETSGDEATENEKSKFRSLDSDTDDVRLPKLVLHDSDCDRKEDDDTEDEADQKPDVTISETIQDLTPNSPPNTQKNNNQSLDPSAGNPSRRASVSLVATKGRARSGSFLKTPIPGANRSSATSFKNALPQTIQVGNHTLPAFVQVETLHPGQVFGLRACLDPEERGPIVSLVSGDCEVLQINKKFFMKHCDDAIYSLIRLKAKAFPSQEDLIDRLDINMQWEEYKQRTMQDFLQRCRRSER